MVGLVGFEGFFSDKTRANGNKQPRQVSAFDCLVGFVGFEGFTDRRSASKCFAQGTGLHPAGTCTK
ncbi:hypothetical protein ASD75_10150 [Acidovorax sp. Root568]|nr:hypothetical protein ASD75_10150 [Acidovorax sp. Root568]